MKRALARSPRCRGQSLIQVLVAVAIGMVLLLGVGQIFLGSNETYRSNDALARIQENGRFASEFLSYDLHHAGFLGCDAAEYPSVNNIIDLDRMSNEAASAVDPDLEDSIRGYTVEDDGSLPAELVDLGLDTSGVLPGTDVVVVRRAAPCGGGRVSDPMSQYQGPIDVSDAIACGFIEGDVVLITDCQRADLFRITDNSAGGGGGHGGGGGGTGGDNQLVFSGNLNGPDGGPGELGRRYAEDAHAYRFVTSIYYIAENPENRPALYRDRLLGGDLVSEELVEGIESLAFEYGEDTNGDRTADDYRREDDVVDWVDVVSVRYELVSRSSEDGLTEDPQTYRLGGQQVTADDNRLRRVFGSTAAIRNRLP